MKHIYHYSARLTNYEVPVPWYVDGILVTETRIAGDREYNEFTESIKRQNDRFANRLTGIVITSLSYHGTTE